MVFYSEFFAGGDDYGNVEDSFFKKNLFTSSRNNFFDYSFFHFIDIPASENSFSVKWERFSLTNSPFRLVETERVSF